MVSGRLESLALAPGTRAPSRVLVHNSRVLVARFDQRWLIETRTRVVAGNSLPQAVARLAAATIRGH